MEPPREKSHGAHHAPVHGAGRADGAQDTAGAQAYRRIFEMAGLRAPPRESDTPANMATRAAILRSIDTAQHLRERQRQLSNAACPKQETTTSSTDDDDVPELEGSTDDDDVPELEGWHYRDGSGLPRDAESPEDEGAVVNQRRAEKNQRLVQLYSTMDLTCLRRGNEYTKSKRRETCTGPSPRDGWTNRWRPLSSCNNRRRQGRPRTRTLSCKYAGD